MLTISIQIFLEYSNTKHKHLYINLYPVTILIATYTFMYQLIKTQFILVFILSTRLQPSLSTVLNNFPGRSQ